MEFLQFENKAPRTPLGSLPKKTGQKISEVIGYSL